MRLYIPIIIMSLYSCLFALEEIYSNGFVPGPSHIRVGKGNPRDGKTGYVLGAKTNKSIQLAGYYLVTPIYIIQEGHGNRWKVNFNVTYHDQFWYPLEGDFEQQTKTYNAFKNNLNSITVGGFTLKKGEKASALRTAFPTDTFISVYCKNPRNKIETAGMLIPYGKKIFGYAGYGVWTDNTKASQYGFKKGDRVYFSAQQQLPNSSSSADAKSLLVPDMRYGYKCFSHSEVINNRNSVYPELAWFPKPHNSELPATLADDGLYYINGTTLEKPPAPDEPSLWLPYPYAECPDPRYYYSLFCDCAAKIDADDAPPPEANSFLDYRDYMKRKIGESAYDLTQYTADNAQTGDIASADNIPVSPNLFTKDCVPLNRGADVIYDPFDINSKFYLVGMDAEQKREWDTDLGEGTYRRYTEINPLRTREKDYTNKVKGLIENNKYFYTNYLQTFNILLLELSKSKTQNNLLNNLTYEQRKKYGYYTKKYGDGDIQGYFITNFERNGIPSIYGIQLRFDAKLGDLLKMVNSNKVSFYVNNYYTSRPFETSTDMAIWDNFSYEYGGRPFKVTAHPAEWVTVESFNAEDLKHLGVIQKWDIMMVDHELKTEKHFATLRALHGLGTDNSDESLINKYRGVFVPGEMTPEPIGITSLRLDNKREGSGEFFGHDRFIKITRQYTSVDGPFNVTMYSSGVKPLNAGATTYSKDSKEYWTDQYQLNERSDAFTHYDATMKIIKSIAVAELFDISAKIVDKLAEEYKYLQAVAETRKQIEGHTATKLTKKIAMGIVKGYLEWRELMDLINDGVNAWDRIDKAWEGINTAYDNFKGYYAYLWEHKKGIHLTNITCLLPFGPFFQMECALSDIQMACMQEATAIHGLALWSDERVNEIAGLRKPEAEIALRTQANIKNSINNATVESAQKQAVYDEQLQKMVAQDDRSNAGRAYASNITGGILNAMENNRISVMNDKYNLAANILYFIQEDAKDWEKTVVYMDQCFDKKDIQKDFDNKAYITKDGYSLGFIMKRYKAPNVFRLNVPGN